MVDESEENQIDNQTESGNIASAPVPPTNPANSTTTPNPTPVKAPVSTVAPNFVFDDTNNPFIINLANKQNTPQLSLESLIELQKDKKNDLTSPENLLLAKKMFNVSPGKPTPQKSEPITPFLPSQLFSPTKNDSLFGPPPGKIPPPQPEPMFQNYGIPPEQNPFVQQPRIADQLSLFCP